MIWIWEHVYPVVANKEQLMSIGFKYIGSIPPIKESLKLFGKENVNKQDLICRPEVHTMHSLAFHYLRAKLQQAFKSNKVADNSSFVIATVSSFAGEGKSFISTNLALSFGSVGKKTLIVDCDYRRSSLENFFKNTKEKGLVEFLNGGVPLKDVLNKEIYPHTDYIASGDFDRLSRETFTSEQLQKFIDHLKGRYDVIILDTPAFMAGPEGLILSDLSDIKLFVASFNQTRLHDSHDIYENLFENGRKNVYAVINKHDIPFRFTAYSQYFMDESSRKFKDNDQETDAA